MTELITKACNAETLFWAIEGASVEVKTRIAKINISSSTVRSSGQNGLNSPTSPMRNIFLPPEEEIHEILLTEQNSD